MPNIYKSKKWLPLFLIPAFLFMAVYLYYPFFMNILNSFQSIRTLGLAAGEWNDPWYTNYVMLFQDAEVWTSLKNTCIMIVVTLVVQVGLALVLALMVDNVRHGTQFFRTVYFFPIFISATALKTAPKVDESKFNSLQVKAISMMSKVTSFTGAVQDLFNGECRTSTFDGMPELVSGKKDIAAAVQEGLDTYASMN